MCCYTVSQCKGEKNPVMVEAGYKAWATRRANTKRAKRVAAAKKAWITIRINKLREARHFERSAGRKAAMTRQINQLITQRGQ